MNRKQFLTNLIRISILGGIGIVTGTLLYRNKTKTCEYIYLCKGCNKINTCKLDEAKQYKKNKENQ